MQGIDRRRWLALALSSPVVLAGCGGGTDTTKAHVRFVNISGYDDLTLRVDGDELARSVARGAASSYRDVDPGDADSELWSPDDPSELLSFEPSLSEDDDYAIVAWGHGRSLGWQLIDENASEPDDDKTSLRIFNGASEAGSVDVYVTSALALLDTSTPRASPVAAGTLIDPVTLNAGTWRVRVTATGSTTDVRLDRSDVVFPGGKVVTLLIGDAIGGVLVDGLLLRDRSTSVASLKNQQARVRAAAVTAGGTTVNASVAGTSLLSSAGSPAHSGYAPITAGTPTVSLSVGGAAVDVAQTTLEAGSDATLVACGSADAPQAFWLVDDDALPTDSTKAKLRIVHAVAELSLSTLSVTLEREQVGSTLAFQEARYASVDPTPESTGGTIVVTSSAGVQFATRTAVAIDAARVYTLVVGGTEADPILLLIGDR